MRQVSKARPAADRGQGNNAVRCGATPQRAGVVASAARKWKWNLLFAIGQKQKKKKGTDTAGAATAKTKTLRHACTESRSAESSKQCRRTVTADDFHKAIGNWQFAIRWHTSLHVPIVAVVSAGEICCPARLPADDLAILTAAAANEAPTPSPEARSSRRRLLSGTAQGLRQVQQLAAIADCCSRAHQSGPRAREAALGLGACPALTNPPPCTVSSQPSNCAYCGLPCSLRSSWYESESELKGTYGQERRRHK